MGRPPKKKRKSVLQQRATERRKDKQLGKKSSESTSVTIKIAGQAIVAEDIGAETYSFSSKIDGNTGKAGHAEMNALDKFICEIADEREIGPTDAVAIAASILGWSKATKSLSCPTKPVCGSCSLVMQELGFKIDGTHTKWSKKKMGSTQWGASALVQQLLVKYGKPLLFAEAMLLSDSNALPPPPVATKRKPPTERNATK